MTVLEESQRFIKSFLFINNQQLIILFGIALGVYFLQLFFDFIHSV